MIPISRRSLFSKLNATSFKALDSATVLCKLRGNAYIDLAHWLATILELQDSDFHRIVRHFRLDAAKIIGQVNQALEQLPLEPKGLRDLSPELLLWVEQSWLYASLMSNRQSIRTADLLVALLQTEALHKRLSRISGELARIPVESLCEQLPELIELSVEHRQAEVLSADQTHLDGVSNAFTGGQNALKRFTVNLTELAKQTKLDPVIGREKEVSQLADILLRRRQNNPLITGEAGVGKTAVVEGFARLLASGQVPPALRGTQVLSLDLGLLQAGAGVKGEFEQRLRQVIDEVQASPAPVVLFIDEIHTLVGAGGAAGTSDAANLLKPALARGQLRTIGATTWTEYKKYIEKDPALTRRFQVVQVHEPEPELAIDMLDGMADQLAKHHQTVILREAVEAAVYLSHRYLPDRQLPDKAISLLDTACSRVALSQTSEPLELLNLQAEVDSIDLACQRLRREQERGLDHSLKIQELTAQSEKLQNEASALRERWQKERELTQALLNPPSDSNPDGSHADAREAGLKSELTQLQGQKALVYSEVTADLVARVLAAWTGIPVGKMVNDEISGVLDLSERLSQRILGQDHALGQIAERIQIARARLDDPCKPVGVFLLAGTSGVGKTETALALADLLYGGEQNLITINMSEFQESHTVSTLKGSPPGYVGYGEGGVLTEAVRRRPYSVVLLDEVEKAHPDVHELFFQVFDKGWMEDGEGRKIDFKNTLILLTTNAGTPEIMRACHGGCHRPAVNHLLGAIRPALLDVFPPALLGRMTVVPYYPLNDEMLFAIVRLQIQRIVARLQANHQINTTVDQAVYVLIASRCLESDSGGRVVHSILNQSVLPSLSRQLLELSLQGQAPKNLSIGVQEGELFYHFE
ncbi:MAG: type VI secretion system ATPase TssH [Limnobacter sp.]|nr:type VI secretion system ATPase TssH [Limnobacter sp.]